VYNLEGSPHLKETQKNIPNQIMPFEVDDLIDFMKEFGLEKFHVALANNHILDNGVEAFDYLISRLNDEKVTYFGTKNKQYTIIDGVALLNFVTGETVAKKAISESRLNYLFYDVKNINKQILHLETNYEKLVMYPHWGRDMDTTIFSTYDNLLKFNKKW